MVSVRDWCPHQSGCTGSVRVGTLRVLLFRDRGRSGVERFPPGWLFPTQGVLLVVVAPSPPETPDLPLKMKIGLHRLSSSVPYCRRLSWLVLVASRPYKRLPDEVLLPSEPVDGSRGMGSGPSASMSSGSHMKHPKIVSSGETYRSPPSSTLRRVSDDTPFVPETLNPDEEGR